jgi:hypothetical protein
MFPAMSGPLRDLIHAWRGLTQKPGFFIGALLTVAIGISANVAIFSFVNAIRRHRRLHVAQFSPERW